MSSVWAERFAPAAVSTPVISPRPGQTDKVFKAETNEDQRNVDKIEYSGRMTVRRVPTRQEY